jgi:hypothetical protein
MNRCSPRKAIILKDDASSGEHQLGILEAQPMFGEVRSVLRLIPFVLHFALIKVQLFL